MSTKSVFDKSEIKALESGKFIAILWSVDDIKKIRADLSVKQAKIVLHYLKENHDATMGINWDVIDMTCETLYPIGN